MASSAAQLSRGARRLSREQTGRTDGGSGEKPARGDKPISIGENATKFARRCVCAACPCPPGCFIVRLHIAAAAAAARGRASVHVSKRKKETAEASDIGGVGGDGTPSSCYVSPFTNSPRGPRGLQPSIFVFHPPTRSSVALSVRAFPAPPRFSSSPCACRGSV